MTSTDALARPNALDVTDGPVAPNALTLSLPPSAPLKKLALPFLIAIY